MPCRALLRCPQEDGNPVVVLGVVIAVAQRRGGNDTRSGPLRSTQAIWLDGCYWQRADVSV